MGAFEDKEIDSGLEQLAQLEQLEMLGGGKSSERPSASSSSSTSTATSQTNSTVQPQKAKKHNVMWVLGGGILQDKSVLKQLPLGLMVLGFGILTVGNRYYVEDLSREKLATEERISYLREHKIEMQKYYQETIKISAIATELDTIGVGLKSGAPYGI